MAYKHILIAVDLSPESKVLVDKAVSMARPYNAKVSLIHVDVNYSDLYTGLIDVNLGDMQKRISEETHHALSELSTNAGYPITETLSGSGDLGRCWLMRSRNTIWTWWFAVTIRTSGAS
jgi:universal stress protein A